MRVTKSGIISRVRLLLDEIGLNDSGFETGKDEQELDTLIGELALEALRFVNINAPRELLEADKALSSAEAEEGSPYAMEDGILPDTKIGVFSSVTDFLRLVQVRCSAWSKPVFDAVKDDTPEWEKLGNRFLTGTPEYPEVGISKSYNPTSSGLTETHEISLYCIPTEGASSATAEVYYMAKPEWEEIEEDVQVKLSFLLQDAYYYYLAYLVMMALGDSRGKTALEQAMPLMGLATTNAGANGE